MAVPPATDANAAAQVPAAIDRCCLPRSPPCPALILTLLAQIHYEGGGSRTPATDIICPMYARVHQVLKLAELPGMGCLALPLTVCRLLVAAETLPGCRPPTPCPCPPACCIIPTVWPGLAADETRPVILCEYAHSMGNSTGNVREYWEAFESHPHLQARLGCLRAQHARLLCCSISFLETARQVGCHRPWQCWLEMHHADLAQC